MLQISGQSHARCPETLVADLLAKSKGDVLQIRATLRSTLARHLVAMTLLATSKVDVPVNLGAAHTQYPEKPSGPTYPSRPKSKLCKNPAPAGTRHPKPGTLLKKFPGFCQEKSLDFSILLVLSSCSSKEPGQQDGQDGEIQTFEFGGNESLHFWTNPNPKP